MRMPRMPLGHASCEHFFFAPSIGTLRSVITSGAQDAGDPDFPPSGYLQMDGMQWARMASLADGVPHRSRPINLRAGPGVPASGPSVERAFRQIQHKTFNTILPLNTPLCDRRLGVARRRLRGFAHEIDDGPLGKELHTPTKRPHRTIVSQNESRLPRVRVEA